MRFTDGFLILDKPQGITSAAAVAQVKRILQCKTIGHAGTLDPLASGILPLAVGEATKAVSYVTQAVKQYRFTITFGQERDTDDSEGQVTQTTQHYPQQNEIMDALAAFTGEIMQQPPIFSALKVNGKRAYAMARAGQTVELQPRPVRIYALNLEEAYHEAGGVHSASFNVTCGKGTYVRSLARDIARKVNSLGYISMLRRTQVGRFGERQAILLDKLPQSVHNAALFEAWVPIELALDDIPAIEVETEQARKLRHGQSLRLNTPDGNYVALHQRTIVALTESAAGMLRPVRVFNLND